ncbi:MAG: cytochrome P450 [Propionibacteriales bacterium]|nr:cytochrome P450 [Propionibacteriales bacterium]
MSIDNEFDIDFDELFADEEEENFLPATGEQKPEFSAIDISTKAFWARTSEERDESFAALRRTDPVSWQRPVEDAVTPDPDDPGYWALVKHEHITQVSKDSETFISGQGVLFDMLPRLFLQMTQSFLAMDDPRHNKLRKLVSAAFTPKQIKKIDEDIRRAAREIVDELVADGPGEVELVEKVAEKLPNRMFCDLFGVPEELREQTATSAGDIIAWADLERLGDRSPDEVQVEAAAILHDIAEQLIEVRKNAAEPSEDLFTNLMNAEVDGEHLNEFEIGAFFVLMAVAGTDTTKHTTSFALKALAENPDQLAYLREDYDGRIPDAIEEFIRFASPVMTFRRTCVKETELAGKKIIPGDKVVLFYPSGSFDEDVFEEPHKFNLARNPNPHLGFGGGGVHFCLGNQLAKQMLRAIFQELVFRLESWETGEPELLGTNFMRGVKRMQLRFVPAPVPATVG